MKRKFLAWMLAGASSLAAQTQIDIKTQAKDVDLSGAAFVKPFPVGTALPVTCTIGSMFFNSASQAGANVFGCSSANLWSPEGSGAIGGLTVSVSSATVVTVGGSCSAMSPCLVRVGSVVYSYTSAATVTILGGSGAVYLYIDQNGNIVAGESAAGSPSLSCAACSLASPVSQFPTGTIPLAIIPGASGSWQTLTNELAVFSEGPTFSAGPNINLTQTGSSITVAATLTSLPNGAQPACAAGTGGYMWYIPGTTGVKDGVQVCAKDVTNTFAWRTLY